MRPLNQISQERSQLMEPREDLHRTAFGIARDLNDGHAQRAAATLQAEADMSRRMPDGATRMAVLAQDIMHIQRESPRPLAVLRENDVQNQCGQRLHALSVDGYDERYRRNIHSEVARIPVGLARDYREANQITLTPSCRTDGSTLHNWDPRQQYDQRGYERGVPVPVPRGVYQGPRAEYPPQGVIIQENPVGEVLGEAGRQFLRGFGRELGSNAADNIIKRRQDVYIHNR
jgi:hypothetical protein